MIPYISISKSWALSDVKMVSPSDRCLRLFQQHFQHFSSTAWIFPQWGAPSREKEHKSLFFGDEEPTGEAFVPHEKSAEAQSSSGSKDIPKARLGVKVQEEPLCPAFRGAELHLPLLGPPGAVPVPDTEFPVPWPHTFPAPEDARVDGHGTSWGWIQNWGTKRDLALSNQGAAWSTLGFVPPENGKSHPFASHGSGRAQGGRRSWREWLPT